MEDDGRIFWHYSYSGKAHYSDLSLRTLPLASGEGQEEGVCDRGHFPFKSRRLMMSHLERKIYGLTKDSAFGIVEKMKRMDQCQN